MSTEFTVQIDQRADSFRALDQHWGGFKEPNPLRDVPWFRSWWENYGLSTTPYLVQVRRRSGATVAVLPLYRCPHFSGGRVLRSMGDTGVCSDYFSVCTDRLLTAEERGDVAAQIGETLAAVSSDQHLGWEWIELDGVAANDSLLRQVMVTCQTAGASVHATTRLNLWRLDTTGDFEDYLASLSRPQRRSFRKWLSTIEASPNLQVRHPQSAAEVHAATQKVIELHQQRWTNVNQAGTFGDQRAISFVNQLTQDAFANGSLHLPLLTRDGKIVAGEIGLRGRDNAIYLWCMGRSHGEIDSQAGNLLTATTIRTAFAEGRSAVDYLRGDEEYKQRLHAKPEPCLQVRIASPAWSGRVFNAMWRTGFEVTQFLRRRTGRKPVDVVDLCSASANSV